MSATHKTMPRIPVSELNQVMVLSLTADGRSPDYIAGFIAAQEFSGWLRPQCPDWIRRSALLIYSSHVSASKAPGLPVSESQIPDADSPVVIV